MSRQAFLVAVGKRIRALRRASGGTLESLASEAHIDPTYLGAIERGSQNPTLRVLERLAEALGVSVAALVSIEAGRPKVHRLLAARVARLSDDEAALCLRLIDAIKIPPPT